MRVSDLPYALHDLHVLSEITRNILTDMDYGIGDDRNHELDRVASLVRIISDQISLLAAAATTLDFPGQGGTEC